MDLMDKAAMLLAEVGVETREGEYGLMVDQEVHPAVTLKALNLAFGGCLTLGEYLGLLKEHNPESDRLFDRWFALHGVEVS